jgi:hypothetical protein
MSENNRTPLGQTIVHSLVANDEESLPLGERLGRPGFRRDPITFIHKPHAERDDRQLIEIECRGDDDMFVTAQPEMLAAAPGGLRGIGPASTKAQFAAHAQMYATAEIANVAAAG